MTEYIKIPNVFKREEHGNNKLIPGEYSTEELRFLSECDWVWTEKIDGTNIRVIWDGYRVEFRGRTDRADIPKDLRAVLENTFGGPDKEELFEQAFGAKPVILFGEGYGGRIQTAGPKYGQVRFILFDVMVGAQKENGELFFNGTYLKREAVEELAEVFGVDAVPIVGHGTLPEAIEFIKSEPTSTQGDLVMEGVVCRPSVELRSRSGDRVIVKVKWRDFKPNAQG